MYNFREQVSVAKAIATDIHTGKKGQSGGGLVGSLIGLLVIAIIGIAVVYPVVVDVVNNSTATGTQQTILNILPLLVLVVLVLALKNKKKGLAWRA